MAKIEKKAVTLSLPVETNEKLSEIAAKYNMTKSGLVNFWVNQTEAKGGNIWV